MASNTQGKPAAAKGYWTAIGGGTVGVIVLCGVAAHCSFKNVSPLELSAAAALSFIAGASVAIERILEGFWTIIDMTAGSGWPGWPLDAKIGQAATSLDGGLAEFKTALAKAAQTAPADRAAITARIAQLQAVVQTLEGPVDTALKTNALARIDDGIDALTLQFKNVATDANIDSALAAATTSVTLAQEVLSTFQSNPARRLASIVVGAILGVGIAIALHLNVYAAATGQDQTKPDIWIAITGLVMGLGSTPTHELIKALQKRKSPSGDA